MNSKKYKIGGFEFTDEETAKTALKEQKAIEYIVSRLDADDSKSVLKAYNQLLEQDIFHTELGLSFMETLRKNLQQAGELPNDSSLAKEPQKEKIKQKEKTKDKKEKIKKKATVDQPNTSIYKKRSEFFMFTTIVLLICVCAMFFITSTSNSPNILNYEEQIINKYETWENNLKEREQAVSEKEKQLGLEKENGE